MITRAAVTESGGRGNVYANQPRAIVDDSQTLGFNGDAEQANRRLAMICFVSLLLFEICAHQGLSGWLASL